MSKNASEQFAIKGFPLEFKLLFKGDIVGYMRVSQNKKEKWRAYTWEYRSVDSKKWKSQVIFFDEIRQWTGLCNVDGKNIYFGDMLAGIKMNTSDLCFAENAIMTYRQVLNLDSWDGEK